MMPTRLKALRMGAAGVVAAGALAFAGSGTAWAKDPCGNLQPGENNPGFSNTNVGYTVGSDFQYVGGQRVTVNLDGSYTCDEPGSRYVRAVATLWDGSGSVDAYIDWNYNGNVAPLSGTGANKNPGDFFNPTYSNIWNAAGLTVRACGNFHTNGHDEIHCGPWVGVPG